MVIQIMEDPLIYLVFHVLILKIYKIKIQLKNIQKKVKKKKIIKRDQVKKNLLLQQVQVNRNKHQKKKILLQFNQLVQILLIIEILFHNQVQKLEQCSLQNAQNHVYLTKKIKYMEILHILQILLFVKLHSMQELFQIMVDYF